MNEEIKEPHIDDALIRYLDWIIKDVAPELDQTDRAIWFNRGRVDVLRHIRSLHTRQRENMLGASYVP